MESPFTRDYLLQLFEYNRERGILIWKDHWVKNKKMFLGKVAGTIHHHGYPTVRIGLKGYEIHRLIWFIEKNEWPDHIDHLNGNRSDNAISNLSNVSNRKNCQNSYRHRAGKLVGACFQKQKNKWKASCYYDKKQHHLGYFNTELEAHQRYISELKVRGLL